jgi:hypothetical protein
MEDLKKKYFRHHPDEPVIFHRKDLIRGTAPFDTLKDEEIRQRFDNELLDLLKTWNYMIISVCLDKKKHKQQYITWRYDPYHYCLAVLLERFVFFLEQQNSRGDVLAESRGGKEDVRLKKAFRRLWEKVLIMKKALSGPMAFAIHLRKSGLILRCIKKISLSRKKIEFGPGLFDIGFLMCYKILT